nr:PREDICTED: serine/threonine-protein phosphatase 6 regulatory ankyrin repeat subunit A-like [Daucus carota subsp. sativus]
MCKNPGGALYEIYDIKAVLYAAAIAGDADAIAKLETEADRLNKDEETILHVESKKGNLENVRFILREFAHKNLLVKLDNQKETALTWAAYFGHTEVAEVLIDAARNLPPSDDDNPVTSFQAFLRLGDKDMDTALHIAVINNHIAIVKLLVEADPSDTHIQNNDGKTPIYIAVKKGYKEIVKLICTSCTAPSLKGPGVKTALHAAIKDPDHDNEVVEILIGAARLLSSSDDDDSQSPVSSFQAFLRQGDKDMNTALHIAVMQGNLATTKILLEADPSDPHLPNNKGETPMYIAAEKGYSDIVKMICTTCTSPSNLDGPCGTALHAAIKNLDQDKKEDIDVIRVIIKAMKWMGSGEDSDSDEWDEDTYEHSVELFRKTDENRCTCLELAVDRNYANIVELILAENPIYQSWNAPDFIDLMPLIYRAMDKEYTDIVKLLTSSYERGADITYSYDDMAALISAIKGRKRESVFRLLDDCADELVTFVDNLGWTALHHAAYHEFDAIIYPLIKAQKEVENQFLYEDMILTPFHVAAEKGYTSTVILLMQLWPSSSSAYIAVDKNGQNILHLAALQSKKEMIEGILNYCPEKHKDELVNKQDNSGNTPLHILIRRGCFVPELMKYEGLDIVKKNKEKWTPPDMLYFEDQIIDEQVQIKVALDEIQINQKEDILVSSVLPSKRETKDRIFNKQTKLMMREKHARMKEDLERYKNTHAVAHWFPDAIAGDANARAALEMEADILNEEGETILHVEAKKGDTERVRYIVREFANKNLLVKLDRLKQTSLHLAAHHGHTEVVEVLVNAARHLSSSSANEDPVGFLNAFVRQVTAQKRNTALHVAVNKGNVAIVKLLVEADPSGRHFPNDEGKMPIYIAVDKGSYDIIKVICTTCTALCLDGPAGSTTALHAAILNIHRAKEEDRDVIGMMIDAAKRWSNAEDRPNVSFEALFNKTDMSGHTVLELAVDRNYVDTVELILRENPAYQHGRGSKNSLMRLIYKAIDKEYTDIVRLLSETYEAGITTGHKGVVALIIAINRRDEDSVIRILGEAKHLVTFADDQGWTPLHYAAYQEFVSILDVIIKALKDVKYQFVYGDMVSTPFHLAAECKYTSTVIRLMQSWPASSSAYTAVNKNGQNILHLAATNNKKEMIQGILKYCPEKYKDKILEQQDANGDTPLHLLISNGCFIPELIKHKGLDTMAKNKKKWTPRDMLYFQEEIIADQVQIKIALDDVQTTKSWKFWVKNMEKKTDIDESSVRPSRRETKDVIFNEEKKLLMDAKHGRMKKDLERYKKRTNTQIIVTALITTVTFTVGFTMPGGLHQSGEVDEGLVVLTRKTAFNAFMVSDALALLLSTCSLFLYFLESMYEDPHQVSKLNAASVGLNIVSIMAMMLTFITGTYLVLSHSLAIAITVCLIGSFFFIFVIVLLIKLVYDRQVKRNED